MITQPQLLLVCGALGLLVGTVIVFAAPRLAAYRLDSPPERPGWRLLFPIAGTLAARWRPRRATITEVGLCLIFAGLSVRYGSSIKLTLALCFTALLALIAYVDIDYRLVLNRLSFPGIALALAASWLWPGIGILSALFGAGLGLLLFVILQMIGRGALGTGDTKLAVLIGAIRGFPGGFSALLLGVLLGSLGAAFFLFVLRRGRRDFMAYAPYLSAGAVLSFFLTTP